MPKWKANYEGGRKYNQEWEKTFPWCKKATDRSSAFCKLCSTTIQPKSASLKKHEESAGHKTRVSNTQTRIGDAFTRTARQSKSQDDLTKAAELELAVNIACHGSIKSVDHISELLKKHGQGSTLGSIRMHRTKCAAIIKNVIAPVLKEQVAKEIKDKPYALLVDESTDVSTNKLLCVCVRYFSEDKSDIITALIALLPITVATGENLYNTIVEELEHNSISISNCIGFASDGASAMVGEHNSLWSRLKTAAPHCVQMKCICHSLALSIQHAFSKLPTNIGFLLSEIPSWFCNSTLRREGFKEMFETMNVTEDPDLARPLTSLPFEKMSATRWLVRGKVLYNILYNWEELKAYFITTELSQTRPDTRYRARHIKDLLNSRINYLYVVFATPVVQEFERINSLFQKEYEDPHTLVQELMMHQRSLHSRLYTPTGAEKALTQIDYGAKFVSELFKCKDIDSNQIRQRCKEMLLEALSQVNKRIPSSSGIFKNLSFLSPEVILSQTKKRATYDLPFQHLTTSAIEEQYRKLSFVDWKEEEQFNTYGIPTDSVKFWVGVLKHSSFKELATYALSCLTTPVSNATVERIFSLVSAIKTKPRNRMEVALLDSITRIRTTFIISGKCCIDFKPSPTMIQRHNKWKHTQSSASTSVSSEQNTDEVDSEEFIHASLAMMDE